MFLLIMSIAMPNPIVKTLTARLSIILSFSYTRAIQMTTLTKTIVVTDAVTTYFVVSLSLFMKSFLLNMRESPICEQRCTAKKINQSYQA